MAGENTRVCVDAVVVIVCSRRIRRNPQILYSPLRTSVVSAVGFVFLLRISVVSAVGFVFTRTDKYSGALNPSIFGG